MPKLSPVDTIRGFFSRDGALSFTLVAVLLITVGVLVALSAGSSQRVSVDAVNTTNNKNSSQSLTAPLSEEEIEQVAIFESVAQLFPADAYMIAHITTSTVDDPNEWWETYSTFLEESGVKIPDALDTMSAVKSITYSGYKSRAPELAESHPLSKQIVLTTNLDDMVDVFDEINTETSGEVYKTVFTDPETNRGYVVLSTNQDYELVETLGRTMLDAPDTEGKELTKEVATFETSEEKTRFTLGEASPKLYISFENYTKAMTPNTNEDRHVEFWKSILGKGLALKPDSVWLGESQNNPWKWEGQFVTGGINVDDISIPAIETARWEQYELDSDVDITPEMIQKSIEDGSAIIDFGYINPGLVFALEFGASISYQGETVGGYLDVYEGVVHEIEPKKDDVLRITISPRSLLQGAGFAARDNPIKYIHFTYDTQSDNTSIEFVPYTEKEKEQGTQRQQEESTQQ